jgi:hypothetical protein
MGAVFPHPVRIYNTLVTQGALNPWEEHAFLYPHFAIPDPMTCITGYSLSGDVPAGISVDGAGNIKGTIKWFGEQPSCQDNWPVEGYDADGYHSAPVFPNFKIPGRFKHQTYLFKFMITVYWIEKEWIPPVFDEDGNETAAGYWKPCSIPGTTTECVEILEVKDHNICNYFWLNSYINKGGFNIGIGQKIGPLNPK